MYYLTMVSGKNIAVVVLGTVVAIAQSVAASDFEQHRAEMRRQFDQHRAEVQKKLQEGAAKFGHQQSQIDFQRRSAQFSSVLKDPPFDAPHAPKPDLCFLKFVETARDARSMDTLFAFLPAAQQKVLQDCQKNYDPSQNAAKKAWFDKQPGKKLDNSFLLQSPYD
ncbi:MAG: hypothetical protein ACRD3W_11670, partial [Terriglobales bacterium]